MSAESPNPLLVPLGRALEQVLNALLALDAAAQARLQALQGRALEFGWAPAGIGLRAEMRDGRIAIGPRAAAAPDLSMQGSLAGFLRLALPEFAGRLPPGKVSVQGDAELAREFEQLLRGFRPDLILPIERGLGPEAGAVADRIARSLLPRLGRALSELPRDLADYVRDERQDAVAQEELEDFAGDVDRLRDDVERLVQRVARLGTDPAR
jgi:ubiquinone biosynthesis protein UbiJ